jgi:hypothetical protein
MDKYLKITLMLVSLMVGFGVFYYFVIHLPGLEKQKIEQAEREKVAAEAREVREKMAAEAREARVKLKYDTCLYGARKNYEANWATACESVSKVSAEKLRACLSDRQIINNPSMGENYCRRIYTTIDPSSDCILPKPSAESINQTYKQEQEKCLAEARAGL